MIAYLGTLKPPVPPTPVAPYNLDYLVIAGGGAGGGTNHGDYVPLGTGGAGGYISGLFASVTDSAYYIFIGAGGVSAGSSGKGNNSYLQSFSNKITSIGGGGPGYNALQANFRIAAQNGGSGYGSIGTPGAGILGQGFPGGSGLGQAMGGGGGAGQAGADYNLTAKGGDGLTWLDGITRAGGGGGFTDLFIEGAGGAGGGGNGGIDPNVGQPGAVNTGSGGGGSATRSGGVSGGLGGSGIVKVRYSGTPRATGGTITQNGGFTYHEFTSSGRLIFTS